MTSTPHEPLSPEERALADRLKRLGPHEGPSPTVDARILAAARAAAAPPTAPRHVRRWLPRLAVPGTLVTAVGTAAAFALVIGVAWQLRPAPPPGALPGDIPSADDGFVAAEVIRRPAGAIAPPPPPPDAPTPPARAARPAPAPSRAAVARTAAPRVRPATPASRHAAPAMPVIHQPLLVESAADAPSAPAPAPLATRAAAPASVTPQAAARPASPPVREDASLPPGAWLQRVRERRDRGDLDGARASLRRFRREYPLLRVPSDLRPLLR